jgi:hybrid cluster-associated redox disulfide protein
MKVTKDTKISELTKHPEAIEFLLEKGIGCVGCPMAASETIEEGLGAHGEDVDKIVEEINKKLAKE